MMGLAGLLVGPARLPERAFHEAARALMQLLDAAPGQIAECGGAHPGRLLLVAVDGDCCCICSRLLLARGGHLRHRSNRDSRMTLEFGPLARSNGRDAPGVLTTGKR